MTPRTPPVTLWFILISFIGIMEGKYFLVETSGQGGKFLVETSGDNSLPENLGPILEDIGLQEDPQLEEVVSPPEEIEPTGDVKKVNEGLDYQGWFNCGWHGSACAHTFAPTPAPAPAPEGSDYVDVGMCGWCRACYPCPYR